MDRLEVQIPQEAMMGEQSQGDRTEKTGMESGDKWGHHRQDLGLTVHVD
jgi:hypothetical protein